VAAFYLKLNHSRQATLEPVSYKLEDRTAINYNILTMKIVIFLMLFSASLILPTFAFPNSPTIGIELFFSSPKLSLDVPINDNEPIEFGLSYLTTPPTPVYFLAYRKELYSDENSRYTLNMGAFLMTGFNINFGWGYPPGGNQTSSSNIFLPLLDIERENIISRELSFSIKAGFPELLSIGLRYYL